MAINDSALPTPHHGSWRVLAGLFDEAWEHGRKRLSRVLLLVMLAMVGGATLILATSGGTSGFVAWSGGRTADAPYRVCAANIYGLWRFTYGATTCSATGKSSRKLYSYYNLVVPAGATVDLTIAPSDIAHSLRIAALGLTIHAGRHSPEKSIFRVPHANRTYSGTNKTYPGQCSRGCLNAQYFAGMTVIVMTRAHYRTWSATQRSLIETQTRQRGRLRATLTKEGVLARNSSS